MSSDKLIAACDYLRDTMDPDEIVDFLGISSSDLVDALYDYIDDFLVDSGWDPEDEDTYR